MNTAHLQQIAQRIQMRLQRELDHTIDPRRLILDNLYARDVLLVCEAFRGSELALLSSQFKQALREVMAQAEVPPARQPTASRWPQVDSTGFGPSSQAPLSTLPGDSTLGPAAAAAKRRGWLSPSRWLQRP